MRKYHILKYLPWIFLPFSIFVIVLLREGTLMALGLNFDFFHNLCSLSAVSGFLISINFEPIQTILVKPSIRIGINTLILTILLGPVFCGYICPFGTLQRAIKFVGKGIGFRIKAVPFKLDKILRVLKYITLIMFLFLVFTDIVEIYMHLDPYHSFIRLFYGGITITGGIYLIIVIILSLTYDRPFCKYLCPYGAFFNIISVLRVFRVRRNPDVCINCKICDEKCPVDIKVSLSETVKDMNCLSCHACISNCPKDKAISLKSSFTGIVYFFIVCITIIFALYYIGKTPINTNRITMLNSNITVSSESLPEDNIDLDAYFASKSIPPKEASTLSVFGNFDLDLILVDDAKDMNLRAILAKKLQDEQAENDRLEIEKAQIEKNRIAAEKIAAEAIAKQEQAAKDAVAETTSSYIYNNGIYTATVNGYRPNMVVQVEIKNDVILSVQILDHNETRSYYRYSAPQMIQSIISTNSKDVQVVSGATYTSIGIKSGVSACLNKAKK